MYPYNIKKSNYVRKLTVSESGEDYDNALYNKPYPEKSRSAYGNPSLMPDRPISGMPKTDSPDYNNTDNGGNYNNTNNRNNDNGNYNNANNRNNDNNGNSSGRIPTDYSNNPQQNVINGYMRELMNEALADEKADYDYYARLANMAVSNEDNKIIYSMALDEKKHFDMLKQIYKELFSEDIPNIDTEQRHLLDTPSLNFEKSIFNELEGVEFYRPIMFSFLSSEIRDMIYEIITDEQAHAQKMNYLYTKYNC